MFGIFVQRFDNLAQWWKRRLGEEMDKAEGQCRYCGIYSIKSLFVHLSAPAMKTLQSALSAHYLSNSSRPCPPKSAGGCRNVRQVCQCAPTDLGEISRMRSDVWNVQGCSDICIVARRWLDIGSGHHFLVVIVRVDIVGSYRNVISRPDVVLQPDMVVAKGR